MNGRESDRPAVYQIRVKGSLEPRWSDWFDGLDITPVGEGETVLTGRVADQAALHGILGKILGLGLLLIQVVRREVFGPPADSPSG